MIITKAKQNKRNKSSIVFTSATYIKVGGIVKSIGKDPVYFRVKSVKAFATDMDMTFRAEEIGSRSANDVKDFSLMNLIGWHLEEETDKDVIRALHQSAQMM